MPNDTPNTSTFGSLCNGGKLSNEIYDSQHGSYKPAPSPVPASSMPTQLDPKPFNIKGT